MNDWLDIFLGVLFFKISRVGRDSNTAVATQLLLAKGRIKLNRTLPSQSMLSNSPEK